MKNGQNLQKSLNFELNAFLFYFTLNTEKLGEKTLFISTYKTGFKGGQDPSWRPP